MLRRAETQSLPALSLALLAAACTPLSLPPRPPESPVRPSDPISIRRETLLHTALCNNDTAAALAFAHYDFSEFLVRKTVYALSTEQRIKLITELTNCPDHYISRDLVTFALCHARTPRECHQIIDAIGEDRLLSFDTPPVKNCVATLAIRNALLQVTIPKPQPSLDLTVSLVESQRLAETLVEMSQALSCFERFADTQGFARFDTALRFNARYLAVKQTQAIDGSISPQEFRDFLQMFQTKLEIEREYALQFNHTVHLTHSLLWRAHGDEQSLSRFPVIDETIQRPSLEWDLHSLQHSRLVLGRLTKDWLPLTAILLAKDLGEIVRAGEDPELLGVRDSSGKIQIFEDSFGRSPHSYLTLKGVGHIVAHEIIHGVTLADAGCRRAFRNFGDWDERPARYVTSSEATLVDNTLVPLDKAIEVEGKQRKHFHVLRMRNRAANSRESAIVGYDVATPFEIGFDPSKGSEHIATEYFLNRLIDPLGKRLTPELKAEMAVWLEWRPR